MRTICIVDTFSNVILQLLLEDALFLTLIKVGTSAQPATKAITKNLGFKLTFQTITIMSIISEMLISYFDLL